MSSGDGYVKFDKNQWIFGTKSVERTVVLDNGKFYTKSIRNKASKQDISGKMSDEFSFAINTAGNRISGTSGGWVLADWKSDKLNQGEIQLDITLRRDGIEVVKTYLIHPGTSLIREWATIKNIGASKLKVIDPSFLDVSAKVDDAASLDFHWMTGADNWPGSWTLKNEKLKPGLTRRFDSYDPFTSEGFKPMGDGVNAKILLNDKQIWPASGWAYSASNVVTVPFDVNVNVVKGDKLSFVTNINKDISNDTTAFDPWITYSDGEVHNTGQEFSSEQGQNGWSYHYIENGKYVDLVYYDKPKQWRKVIDNATGTPFVGAGNQHPHPDQDAALVWTAVKSGAINIRGGVTNTGNAGGPALGYGYRMNTQTYAPWFAMLGKKSRNGMFYGFDYFGHWVTNFVMNDDGSVKAEMVVAGHKQDLSPGQSLTTPRSFTGLFEDDLDNAGNECLNWQYRYMWDYTRKGWFPAVRMLGYWMKGTTWSTGWVGGNGDWHSAYQKIFRTADLMRYTGADVFHRDWGWWDKAGEWNGPDFKTANEYLQKYGMGLLIYAFLYTVDPDSKVAKEHPDWLVNPVTLDMSIPATIEFMKGQLDTFREKWGPFEWRNDSSPFSPKNGDDTVMLGQDFGFRKLLKDFLDKHQDCAFQAVNGGGFCAGYDYVRYSSTIQFSDGGVGILSNYYTSLLLPPDKTNHMPDIWNPDNYDPATFHGLLCCNFDMTGDTWDPAKLEGLRDMIDVYHYMQKQGVVGRWVKVYRPIIKGDDPTMYFQRMNRSNKKGIIITKHLVKGAVTIYPKGLLSDTEYDVSFHFGSGRSEKRSGKELMTNGVSLNKVMPGELIYLNMPDHPGSKLDKEAPSIPGKAAKSISTNMGYPGVSIKWSAAKDNNWVSYYAIYRDGIMIDKLAKGTFYFDHSAGADIAAVYEIEAVDGAGNTSEKRIATGPSAIRSIVYDDIDHTVQYAGNWQKQTKLYPAYKGTISGSNEKGAFVEFSFEGRGIMWFSKLGDNCGNAAVTIDGTAAEMVDTFAADNIWGVCVFQRQLSPGKHTIRIEVTGERSENAKDSFVYIDGFRVSK